MLKISESYIIGIDISDTDDTSVMSVSKLGGTKMTIIKTFTGKEAEMMYERLTDQKVSEKQEP